MISDDKRAFKRSKCKFTVKHKIFGEPGPEAGISISKNISLGGVYFTSLQQYHIGELIDCRIEMPGENKSGKWKARVVRVDKVQTGMVSSYGIAVEFVKSFNESENILKIFLK